MTKEKQIEEMAREIRAIKEYTYQSGATLGEIRIGITHSERIAKHLIDNIGYRKQNTESCVHCRVEKCGTCERFILGTEETCATNFYSDSCVEYVPTNYCPICGRRLRKEK